jgi:hypothetical protein
MRSDDDVEMFILSYSAPTPYPKDERWKSLSHDPHKSFTFATFGPILVVRLASFDRSRAAPHLRPWLSTGRLTS